MKKLTYLFIAPLMLLFVACGDNEQKKDTTIDKTKGETIALTSLSDGYFLKNDVVLGEGVNYMVATKESSLTNNFGYGAVMGESHEHPDFNNNIVLAMAVNMKGKAADPSFTDAKLVEGELRVFCLVNIVDEEATYESTPIALASIKRDERVKTISFYEGNTLARRVELSE